MRYIVKSEPKDPAFWLAGDSATSERLSPIPGFSPPSSPPEFVKSEIQQKPSCDVPHQQALQLPGGSKTYTPYVSADDINYSPEGAINEGIRIAESIKASLMELELGTDLHKDVWLRDLENLKNHHVSSTMIAVCGATGAGKSSLLNAILDDSIVATSGMGACTSVVTEIRYHEESMIVAEIEFLKRSEWREELKLLLDDLTDDLTDENGNRKSPSNLSDDARATTWSKVHAVYPLLELEQIINMVPDDIIDSNPGFASRLDTTDRIECPTSEMFGAAFEEFNGSRDHEQDSSPGCWPLIRLVRVWTKAKALSCGAVLVDLPGVADANSARNNIAKDYMKKCKYIWIVAHIMRAADDKPARDLLGEAFKVQLMMDGNYSASSITFIATKTDDISCDELIKPLKLGSHPELLRIGSEIEQLNSETVKLDTEIAKTVKEAKETTKKIKYLQPVIDKCKAQLATLQVEGSSKHGPATLGSDDAGSKKRTRGTIGRKAKKTRIGSNSNSDSMDVDVSDSDSSLTDVDELKAGQVKTWTTILQDREAEIAGLNMKLQRYELQKAEALVRKSECKDMVSELEKAKTMFYAAKRNEAAKKMIKRDFQQGLKELCDSHRPSRNRNTSLPSREFPDYGTLELPVFTCSSRDYARIKKQAKNDGGPNTFTDPKATEIPALQEWCQKLTAPDRQESAHSLLNELIKFLQSIRPFVDNMEDIGISDRVALANMWESRRPMNRSVNSLGLTRARGAWTRQHSQASTQDEEPEHQPDTLNAMAERARQLLTKERRTLFLQHNNGVAGKLHQRLNDVAADYVKQLKETFHDKLEESCRSGVGKASLAAVDSSDKFAARPMRWQTYRAILRRNGEYKNYNLNAKLVGPMVREVAVPWAQVFGPRSDLFAPLLQAAGDGIDGLLQEIVSSAPQTLAGVCQTHRKRSLTEARATLHNIRQNVESMLMKEQKDISRFLICHIKDQLVDTYRAAAGERGRGTSDRQKQIIHDHIESCRGTLFSGGMDTLFNKLDQAADSIEVLLRLAFCDLSEKIEVNVSVLWDTPTDNKGEIIKRHEFVTHIHAMLRQLKLWLAAGKMWVDMGEGDIVMEGQEPTG